MRVPTLPIPAILLLALSPLGALAQFGNLFEQMFSGGGSGDSGSSGSSSGSGGGGGRGGGSGNVASDSSWFRQAYGGAPCSNYLCPDTLACVDKPTHCPCAFPDVEEKFELDEDGLAVCLSKSEPRKAKGTKKAAKRTAKGKSLTAMKVELARKGLL